MTAEQQRGQTAPQEAPVINDAEAHTSEDHRAASPERPGDDGATVSAPFQEAMSLPAPPLEPKGTL
jgi:hypothetical protein